MRPRILSKSLRSLEIVEGEEQRSCLIAAGRRSAAFIASALSNSRSTIWQPAPGRFAQYVDFSAQRTAKLSSVGRAAAGRDPYSIRTVLKKALQAGNGAERILQVIEPEFQKGVLTNLQVGLVEKIARLPPRSGRRRPWANEAATSGWLIGLAIHSFPGNGTDAPRQLQPL